MLIHLDSGSLLIQNLSRSVCVCVCVLEVRSGSWEGEASYLQGSGLLIEICE